MSLIDEAVAQTVRLLSIDSPTGYTAEAEEYLIKTLKELGFAPCHSPKGTVTCCLGGEGHPLLLSAHVDTLGAIVRAVKPNGRLRYSQIGGYTDNTIETENCRVHTRDGRIYTGTVQSTSASRHVYGSTKDVIRSDETLEIVLDETASTREAVNALGIYPGDFICWDTRTVVTPSGYIKSRHLDDKASSGDLLALAKGVSTGEIKLARRVYVMFTVFEEVGHGASVLLPEPIEDMVAVDMGCVGDDLTCTERQVSICAKDSAGPFHYGLTSLLVRLAEANGIDYAVDIYPQYSSDTATALRSGLDARFALIGQGVFASHGYERTHRDGMAATLRLLTALVTRPGEA